MTTIRFGTRNRCVIEVAAIASGGEMIAPKAKAAAHGISGTKNLVTQATTMVVTKTNPNASIVIGLRL
jgi:hypothetical protein